MNNIQNMSQHYRLVRWPVVILLMVSFIFLFQLPYYLKDFKLLYMVSKGVVPLLSIVLSTLLIGAAILRQPVHRVYPDLLNLGLFISVLIILAAIRSWFHYGQSLLYGVTAEVKLTAIMFYPLMLWLCFRLRPTSAEIETAIIGISWCLLIFYYFMNWFVDPALLYTKNGLLVSFDSERGFRYRFPVTTILISLFIYFHRWHRRRNIAAAISLAVIMGYLVVYHKERMMVAAILVTLGWNSIIRLPMRRKMISIVFLSVVGFATVAYSGLFDSLFHISRSPSALVRVNTSLTILKELGTNWWNWIFGVGALNPFNDVTFQSLYGDSFWLSDVGWLGITFEFGVFGLTVILLFWGAIYIYAKRMSAKSNRPWMLALKDYVFMSIILSPIVPSIPYFIGVFATILALLRYQEISDRNIFLAQMLSRSGESSAS